MDDGVARGLETEAGVTWRSWRAEAGVSLLQAERQETGEPLLGRPRISTRGTLGWAHPIGLRADVTGVYTGRTPVQRDASGTHWREGFLRFDARIAQRLPGGLELAVGVDNLIDRIAPEWPTHTGRHVYTSVSWSVDEGGAFE